MLSSEIDPKIIVNLPSSLLSTIPGGTPPHGIRPFSPHPQTLRPQTIAVGSVFLVITIVFFAIRAYVKLFIVKRLTLDDYVCTTGFILSIIQFAGIMLAVTGGRYGYHIWDSSVEDLFSRANAAATWLTTVFVTPALGFAKLTFLIQYYQLFWPLSWVRVACWTGGGASMAFYLAVTITMFVLCSPWPGESWAEFILSKHLYSTLKISIPTGAVGAAVDIFLLVLPIKAVTTLQLPTPKKAGLVFIFLTGTLASVASIVGLAYRIENTAHAADSEWGVAEVWIWLQVELFSGIACSCMPSLSKLLSHQKRLGVSAHTRGHILSYLRGSQHAKLFDGTENSSGIIQSTSTSITGGSVMGSRLEKADSAGIPLSKISGDNETSNVRNCGVEDNRNRIHLLHEVSVCSERGEVEHGGIDRHWR